MIIKSAQMTNDNVILNISEGVRSNGLNLDTLCVYTNKDTVKYLGDNVRWAVTKGDVVGGVALEFDYGFITIDDKEVPVIVSNKIITDEIHLINLDECKYNHKPTSYFINK